MSDKVIHSLLMIIMIFIVAILLYGAGIVAGRIPVSDPAESHTD